MRNKGLPEIIVRAVMNGANTKVREKSEKFEEHFVQVNTKVRVGSELSEEFRMQVGVHQVSLWSPLLLQLHWM